MEYKFAESCNYEHFPSGRVLHHTSGIKLLNFIQKEINIQLFQANALQPVEMDIKLQ